MDLDFEKTGELSPKSKEPCLTDYMDYRSYLQDYYIHRRKLSANDRRPYNYAVFSAGADIKSPNYLKMIIEGRRNLSDEMTRKFSKALGHNKEQSDEFQLLVQYNQEVAALKRNEYLRRLTQTRIDQQMRAGVEDRHIWNKVPNWVVWVLYAMTDQRGFELSLEGIRALLKGKVSDHEILVAMRALKDAGVVETDPATGHLKKARSWFDSADDIPVALIRKLQTEFMFLGLESLYQDPPLTREFGSLTLALTQSEFEELKFQLRKLRKQIYRDNSIARLQSKGERVYQFNVQLFELTHPAKDPEKDL